MTAQHSQPAAGVQDILFVTEQAKSRPPAEKAQEAMFILLSRLNRSFDHERDRERAELLASVRGR